MNAALDSLRTASNVGQGEFEPFYQATGDECALFAAAYAQRLPVLLKGPTGCGKTRFVKHMA